jgi:hypothetical protein
MIALRVIIGLLVSALCASTAWAQRRVEVADDAGLRRALAEAKPGWRIVVRPGKYQAGLSARGLAGTQELPIIVEGADAKDKPVIEGGRLGLHLSDCSHLILRNITVRGQSGNGINIDDGGTFDTPAHHVTLEGVDVADIGPTGNRDAIKLSGIDDLVVRGCVLEGWAGQGIDMVGCHRGLIEGCTFRGKAGYGQQIAVQAKGGSSAITIRGCTFLNAGQRGVNLGGSTSPRVFRPQGAKYEAKDITVEGCRFVGGMAPVAFVGVDGSVVRYNTIYQPEKWVVRILQENTEAGMMPSRGGRFERNLVVFKAQVGRTAVNVGGNTEPGSFMFRENFWYCADQPGRSRVELPTREEGGVYGVDPKIKMLEGGVPGAPAAEEARAYGADALSSGEKDTGKP